MNRLFRVFILLPLACPGACGGDGISDVPDPIDPIKVPLPTKRIVIYGDSRPAIQGERFFMARNDPVMERPLVIQRLVAEKPDLIIHSGDLVARGSSIDHWNLWDESHKPILNAGIPFHAALGNHEYAGDFEKGLRLYFRRFPSHGNCRWYAVRAGPLVFLMLDSNYDCLTESFIRSQDEWFQKTMKQAAADSEVKAVIVVTHHPPYTNSMVHGPSEETRRRFADPAAAYPKFKLFVAGHVHNYERFQIVGIPFVVSGGGGAPLTGVRTSDFRTKPAYKGPEFRPHHYLLLVVAEDRAIVDTMMLQDDGTWKSGDRFEIPW